MASIQVQLLGKFQLKVDGQPAAFARRKSESLLAYLILHPDPLSREKLAGLLWGDSLDEDARRSLRVVLTDIRKTLGEDILLGERDALELNPARITEIDTQKFLAILQSSNALSDSEIVSALELYRSELLEGIYDDWIIPVRENFKSQAVKAWMLLTERARAAGEYLRAAEYAQSALRVDPFYERAAQNVLFCLSTGGDKDGALRFFHNLQKRGEIEFSGETLLLVENIKRQSSESARLTNLPHPATSFIGREDELNEVETLLTQHRLVTLLGAGGSGKTRLAIQAADEMSHQYPDGVWWVDLSPLSEPRLVAQTIARMMGIKDQNNKDILLLVTEHIADRTVLLVLDNCEHLLNASARCVDVLLAHCPRLTVLATSREALGLGSERGWQVPTLPLPEADLNPRQLQKNESVRLFVERGRVANNSFQLNEKNASHIVHICRRLDGIPLAIELAAALLRSLRVEDVAWRLDQRFGALQIADDTRLPRQQTLRALIDWSYNLLNPTEQIFFRRLGVFAGGWTFDAAFFVGGGYDTHAIQKTFTTDESSAALPINPADIVSALLESLRRRSLISITYQGESSRYSMLETLREYALDKLIEAQEETLIYGRHLSFMLSLANEVNTHLQGQPDAATWAERLRPDLDNIRAVLTWSIKNGDFQNVMRLGIAMSRFWGTRGFSDEGRDWLKQIMEHPRAKEDEKLRAHIMMEYARSLRSTNNVARAFPLMEEVIKIFSACQDEDALAFAYFAQGDIFTYSAEMRVAFAPLQEALKYYKDKPQHSFNYANTLSTLGRAALAIKDFQQAYSYIEESTSVSQSREDISTVAWNKLVLGDLAYHQSQLEQAREHYEASVEIYLPMKRHSNLSYLYEALASLAYWRGEHDAAIDLLEKCFESYRIVNSFSTAFSRGYRASIEQARGNLAGAGEWLKSAAQPISDIDDIYRAVYMIKLADYMSALGDSHTAAVLYASALRLTADPSTALFPPDITHAQAELDRLRQSIPAKEFESALARADTLSIEEAVKLVFPDI